MTITEKYPPRALTRGEIKLLRSEGIEIIKLNPEAADVAIDRVMELVYGDTLAEIDSEPNMATLTLFEEIVGRTYGGSEKNSLTPGTGTARGAGSAAGRARKGAAKRAKKHRQK